MDVAKGGKSEVDVAKVGKKAKWMWLKLGKSKVDVARVGKKAKWMWREIGGKADSAKQKYLKFAIIRSQNHPAYMV